MVAVGQVVVRLGNILGAEGGCWWEPSHSVKNVLFGMGCELILNEFHKGRLGGLKPDLCFFARVVTCPLTSFISLDRLA